MLGLRHCQVSQPGSASSHFRGHSLTLRQLPSAARRQSAACTCSTVTGERLRLDNLSPQEGSRHRKRRIGRGYGAGQGGSCGAGMRGQKARSGSTPKPGFEGGQMPLYRRLPKLRGIAGGMKAGVQRFVTINVGELGLYEEGEVVSLETLAEKNLLTSSGREGRLPLKILGEGDLIAPLKIKAVQFSGQAREKIEKAGGTIEEVPAKIRWTKQIGKERKETQMAAKAAGKPAAKPAPKSAKPAKK